MSLELVEEYGRALQKIYDHVGFKENWVICPIDNCLEMYWKLDNDNVLYAENKIDVVEETGNHYSDQIYKQRFYNKWVYEGKDFTMIFCNPCVDGMRYFSIFDNKRRV